MTRRSFARLALLLVSTLGAGCHAGLRGPPSEPVGEVTTRYRPQRESRQSQVSEDGEVAEAPMAAKRIPAFGAPSRGAPAAPPRDEGWRVESERLREDTGSRDDAGGWAEARKERPGLGTEWGETRFSPVHDVHFERASTEPFAVATIHYNDRAGVDAMASYDARRGARLAWPVAVGPGITVSLVGEDGAPLWAVSLGGRVYVVGEAGRRYSVLVENHTGQRVEVVLSIDGLDAIDGQPATTGKRGYLVEAWDRITIDGFRRSASEVAAFRFGSVRGSYAAHKGSDRDVGVVGVALFAERGEPWDEREVERRLRARPFSDSRFAQPPPGWE